MDRVRNRSRCVCEPPRVPASQPQGQRIHVQGLRHTEIDGEHDRLQQRVQQTWAGRGGPVAVRERDANRVWREVLRERGRVTAGRAEAVEECCGRRQLLREGKKHREGSAVLFLREGLSFAERVEDGK